MKKDQEKDLGVPDAGPSVGLFAPTPSAPVPTDQGATIPHATPRKLILRIYDSNGVEIREGDLVMTTTSINIGFRGGFYTYVKVHKGGIYPFSHFSYARIVKVDKMPDGMLPMSKDDDDPIYKGLPPAWYDPAYDSHDEHFSEGENDALCEENRINWKIESMQFEGHGFYRVETESA